MKYLLFLLFPFTGLAQGLGLADSSWFNYVPPTSSATLIQWITNAPTGAPDGTPANFTIGTKLTATTNFTIKALGIYVFSTSEGPTDIGIWDNSGTLLGACTVTNSAVAASQYQFTTLTNSVSISNGSTYFIGICNNLTSLWGNQLFARGAVMTFVFSGFQNACLNSPVNDSTTGAIDGPTNFKYTIP